MLWVNKRFVFYFKSRIRIWSSVNGLHDVRCKIPAAVYNRRGSIGHLKRSKKNVTLTHTIKDRTIHRVCRTPVFLAASFLIKGATWNPSPSAYRQIIVQEFAQSKAAHYLFPFIHSFAWIPGIFVHNG